MATQVVRYTPANCSTDRRLGWRMAGDQAGDKGQKLICALLQAVALLNFMPEGLPQSITPVGVIDKVLKGLRHRE